MKLSLRLILAAQVVGLGLLVSSGLRADAGDPSVTPGGWSGHYCLPDSAPCAGNTSDPCKYGGDSSGNCTWCSGPGPNRQYCTDRPTFNCLLMRGPAPDCGPQNSGTCTLGVCGGAPNGFTCRPEECVSG